MSRTVDSPFQFGLGPMKEDEKNYLIQKGYLHENSQGDLYGEPSTLIDSDEEQEDQDHDINLETNRENGQEEEGQVLFHVGDIAVRSIRVNIDSSDTHSVTSVASEYDVNNSELEQTRTSLIVNISGATEGDTEIDFSEPEGKDLPSALALHIICKENTQNEKSVSQVEWNEEKVIDSQDGYSTPETSYCEVTPPHADCETPPAIDPDVEADSSSNNFYSFEYLKSAKQQSKNISTTSGSEDDDLDDSVVRMEKLIAMADQLEMEEKLQEELAIAMAQHNRQEIPREAKASELIGGLNQTDVCRPNSTAAPEFKTPLVPPPTPKKFVRIQQGNSVVSTTYTRPRLSPIKFPSPIKSPTPVQSYAYRSTPPTSISSTPKSATTRPITSMIQSPISTIGGPTPHCKGKIPVRVPLPTFKKVVAAAVPTTTTPKTLPVLGFRKAKLLSGMVNSPVANYMYSTPTPPMMKRAVKTDAPKPQRLPLRNEVISSLPRTSGIPRFLQSVREGTATVGSNSSRLSESGFNRKSNDGLNHGGIAYGRGRELKLVKYQASVQSTPDRNVMFDPSTPISTPMFDVVKSKENVNFIAQRHTGMRNMNTNESIVQHAEVDKKFFPNRLLVQKK